MTQNNPIICSPDLGTWRECRSSLGWTSTITGLIERERPTIASRGSSSAARSHTMATTLMPLAGKDYPQRIPLAVMSLFAIAGFFPGGSTRVIRVPKNPRIGVGLLSIQSFLSRRCRQDQSLQTHRSSGKPRKILKQL